MKTKSAVRFILMGVMLAVLVGAVLPAAAQEAETVTITLTEVDVNAALSRAVLDESSPLESLSFNFQAGEVILSGTRERASGETVNFEAVIVPSIVEQRALWTLASFEVTDANGIVSPRDPASGLPTRLIDVWEHAYFQSVAALLPYVEQDNLYRLRALEVSSLVITEETITVSLSIPTEDTVAAGVSSLEEGDSTRQIIISERQANDAMAAIARRQERIESFTVDFTADGFVMEVNALTPTNQPLGIIAILIGLVQDQDVRGTLQFRVQNVTVSSVSVAAGDVNGDGLSDFAVSAWSRFIELQVGEASVVSFSLTDRALILVVE